MSKLVHFPRRRAADESAWRARYLALPLFLILSRFFDTDRHPIDPAKPCKGFGDNTLWIITEGDRSVTTFLLPDEY